jgi:hypothetical protein
MSAFRKTSVALFIGALLALAVGAGVWLGRGPLQKGQGSKAAEAPAKAEQAPGVVVIETEAQSRSGIATAPLQPATYRPESAAFGVVVDIQPLLALRGRHATAAAEAGSAEAAIKASRDEYERDRALFADDRNVSLKALQAAEAAYRADQARLRAATATLREVGAAARQQFGETLERWAFDPDSKEFASLIAQREALVRVTLAGDMKMEAPKLIQVDAPGHPRSSAQLVSASPQSDPAVQGRSYFYRSSAFLPSGMRVVARLPVSTQAIEGLMIPDPAIVWYGGQPWAFVGETAQRFVRRPVRGQPSSSGGVFITEGFKEGDRIVVTGAQLLLSEELRPKSAQGAGCKDPECD